MTHYPYIKHSDLSFEFETSEGIAYCAYFFDYGFLFTAYPEFSTDIYSFNLEVTKGSAEHTVPDETIGRTVVAIFREFFDFKKNAVVYICIGGDQRHLARKRKFDIWYWKYNDGTILREDGVAVIADSQIYNSLLLHADNDHVAGIISTFRTLNERAEE